MAFSGREAIDAFSKVLKEWGPAYKHKVTTAILLRGIKVPFVLFARVFCTPYLQSGAENPFKLETEHVLAVREITPFTVDTESWLERACKDGEVEISAQKHQLLLRVANAISTPYPTFTPFSPAPVATGGSRFQVLQIISGPNWRVGVGEIGGPEALDWELKASSSPYTSLDELLYVLGLPPTPQFEQTRLEVVCAVPAVIDASSRLQADKAVIRCIAATTIDPGDLHIGYMLYGTSKTTRDRISGRSLRWEASGDDRRGIIEIPSDGAVAGRIILAVRGAAVQELAIIDPDKRRNARQVIYEVFDPKLEVARRFLRGQGKDPAADLERGVASYLHLAGFSVQLIGRVAEVAEGPDIIAVSDKVLVVECTTGTIDNNDKLAKLAERALRIRDQLAASGSGAVVVMPTIWTTQPRAAVLGDLAKASELKIAVVCKEEIEQIVLANEISWDTERVFSELQLRIPTKTQA